MNYLSNLYLKNKNFTSEEEEEALVAVG